MEQYQTESGRRQDLELSLVDVNPYLGAIGSTILPMQDVAAKTGTYYYQILQADATAQTGRGATTAPTAVTVAENSSTWSTAERIKRYDIPRDRVKTQFGTIEKADRFGARAAIRSVMRYHETEVAATLLANASITTVDIGSSFIAAAQTGLKAIKRYSGKKALVMSQEIFNRVMRYTEITGRFGLSSAAISGVDALSIVSREPAALKLLLRAIIGVDEVLIGDDDLWYTAAVGYQDRCALVALPEPTELSEMENAVLGKTIRYLPDGQDYPYYVESAYNSDKKKNDYDASIWTSIEMMNTGAAYVLDGIDESNAITTTTTTV